MELLYARCAALDVHATNVVACARIATGGSVTYDYLTEAAAHGAVLLSLVEREILHRRDLHPTS
jgi:hypothetical protein